MEKIKIPNTSILLKDGQLSPHWLRFFENICKQTRIKTLAEIGTGDEEQDGNWRIQQDGDNLVIQKKVEGTWSTIDTFTP